MKALIVTSVLGLLFLGCAKKLAGDYTGKQTDSSNLVQNGHSTVTGSGQAWTTTTLRIVGAGDGLSTVVKGCTVLLTPSPNGLEAQVGANQTCPLAVTGYEGKTTVTGKVSRAGQSLTASFAFAPVEPGMSGSYVVAFSGTAQ